MAPRPFWKGYLKLSLVTCPVAMMPAISEREKVRFHTLNRNTGARVESRYLDESSGKDVPYEEQVKGYEKGPGDYVMLEDEELEAVGLESTRTIDISMFVERASIAWIWYDRPHYLLPDDAVGEEAFSVIRDAMAAGDVVGISRLVLYRRERAVLLEPKGKGIVLWTLRYGDEVRDAAPYFDTISGAKPDAKLVGLIGKYIEERCAKWSPDMASDPVQKNLVALIAAKRKGKKPTPKRAPAAAEKTGNVVSIMDALKKSLEAEKRHR